MLKTSVAKGFLSVFLISSVTSIYFQNCSPVGFKNQNNDDPERTPTSVSQDILECEFNGQKYKNGQTIKAYLNSSEKFGTHCQEEIRT